MSTRSRINRAVDATLEIIGEEDNPLNRLAVLEAMWDEGSDGPSKPIDEIIYWTVMRQEITKQKLEVKRTERKPL
jgi:hypothetical protein